MTQMRIAGTIMSRTRATFRPRARYNRMTPAPVHEAPAVR